MASIKHDTKMGLVEGEIHDDRFAPLLDVFLENFAARGEKGAAVSVTHEGKPVIDLWGGSADPKTDKPWTDETLALVFSSTKGALALCAHILIGEGKLDPHAPVTELWPEFGAHGKGGATLQMMLDHTSGVPAFKKKMPEGSTADFEYAASALAEQEPFFAPGTRSAYHGLTFAWTVGKMVRLAAGKGAGEFFAERVAKPLGLEFYIGAPETIAPRMARIFQQMMDPKAPQSNFMKQLLNEPESIPALFFFNGGGFNANDKTYWTAEIGSAAGVTNAKSLARMYAALAMGGTLDGVKLVGPDAIARMNTVTNASHDDATLRTPIRVAGGYMTSREETGDPLKGHLHLGRAAFGHPGAGGSMGFADPEAGLSFAYIMNQMGATTAMNPRGQLLVDEAYKAIGWRRTPHHWRPQ